MNREGAAEDYIELLENRCHELEAKVGRLQEGVRNLLENLTLSGDPPQIRVGDTTAERGVGDQCQDGKR